MTPSDINRSVLARSQPATSAFGIKHGTGLIARSRKVFRLGSVVLLRWLLVTNRGRAICVVTVHTVKFRG